MYVPTFLSVLPAVLFLSDAPDLPEPPDPDEDLSVSVGLSAGTGITHNLFGLRLELVAGKWSAGVAVNPIEIAQSSPGAIVGTRWYSRHGEGLYLGLHGGLAAWQIRRRGALEGVPEQEARRLWMVLSATTGWRWRWGGLMAEAGIGASGGVFHERTVFLDDTRPPDTRTRAGFGWPVTEYDFFLPLPDVTLAVGYVF